MRESQYVLKLIKLNFDYISKEYLELIQNKKLHDSNAEPQWKYLNIKHVQKVKKYIEELEHILQGR